MIFIVDIGNTNVTLGLMQERGRLSWQLRMPTDKRLTVEEFMAAFESVMSPHSIERGSIEGAVISSVVPELTDAVRLAVERMCGCAPLVVHAGMELGLRIDIESPERLGVDMIADAVGAVNEYEGALCIFDLGTATTCSIVSAERAYLGSIIIPGVAISQNALTAAASQLPFVKFEQPRALIGRNTVDSVRSGLVHANAAMVDGLIDRVSDELGAPVTSILTGGISKLIVPACRRSVVYDADLLLKGLWDIYRMNAASLL